MYWPPWPTTPVIDHDALAEKIAAKLLEAQKRDRSLIVKLHRAIDKLRRAIEGLEK